MIDGAQKIETFFKEQKNHQKKQGVNKQKILWFVDAEKNQENSQKEAGIKKKINCLAIFENKVGNPHKQIEQEAKGQAA